MEVHPPQHPLLSWRDFLVHIATITIGLLIAIALEQSVEALHHRHMRRETRENLRREIAANQQQLQRDLNSLDKEQHMLDDDLVALRRLQAHQPVAPDSISFGWYWSSMQDSALQTARETAALALFPIEQVQAYGVTYGQQAFVNSAGIALSVQLTNSYIPLTVQPDVTALTPAQIEELIRSCAAALSQITYLHAMTPSLESQYRSLLASY